MVRELNFFFCLAFVCRPSLSDRKMIEVVSLMTLIGEFDLRLGRMDAHVWCLNSLEGKNAKLILIIRWCFFARIVSLARNEAQAVQMLPFDRRSTRDDVPQQIRY